MSRLRLRSAAALATLLFGTMSGAPALARSSDLASNGPAAGCEWQSGFAAAGPNDRIRATAVYDDGGSPALYAGGSFRLVSGQIVNWVAKWDGSTWSALTGASGTGVNGQVFALAVFDDGQGPALYVAGDFSHAGGIEVSNIARWDGTTWSSLTSPSGTGLGGKVEALAVYDDGGGPALYVAGEFLSAPGATVNRIAKWDGTTWSALSGPAGTGVDRFALALAVHDDGAGPALYVGGRFDTAGGVTAARVAKWDGSTWSALSGPMGNGINGPQVRALVSYDDGGGAALYAAGRLSAAGGIPAGNIAKWDDAAWSALTGPGGEGVDEIVNALAVYDAGGGAVLYVGGEFRAAGGVTVNRVASWNGAAWAGLPGGGGVGVESGTGVETLSVYDVGGGPALYAAGEFAAAGGVGAERIASWDGAAWSRLGTPIGRGMTGSASAMVEWDDGSGPGLYVGGDSGNAGGTWTNGIGRWDGTTWTPLVGPTGRGVNGEVLAAAVYDAGGGPALYVGGDFETAGGVTVNRIARWDDATWSALSGPSATGVNGPVRALAVWDAGGGGALYAAGSFTTAGGLATDRIARWDGSTWSALSGPSSTVEALAVYDDGGGSALYAGGSFSSADGVAVSNIAKWDGVSWAALSGPMGNGVDSAVRAMLVYDQGGGPVLVVGGNHTTAGGVAASHVATWDGVAWAPLAAGPAAELDRLVIALAVHDDGSGPALYAAGDFTTAGGVAVNRVARWRDGAWSGLAGPVAAGTNRAVAALASFDDGRAASDLYAGGRFFLAGGIPSVGIARWGCRGSDIFADGFESGDTSSW